MSTSPDSAFDRVEGAARSVRDHLTPSGNSPRVGIVLGSGLGPLTEQIEDALVLPYHTIPFMPGTSVAGHSGELILGSLSGVKVVCLSGRAHLYEGHEPEDVVFGVRLLATLGIEAAILSNAAGGISPDTHPGTLMLISDHLNLTGKSPLCGPNEARWGLRFPDMSEAYSSDLRAVARRVAAQQGLDLAEGVYAGLLGPTYETPAEIRMLETFGASAVGMSTVLETIALRHLSVRVLGVSCITNKAAGKSSTTLNHEEVAEVAGKTSRAFVNLISGVVAQLGA
jgi:purine-nucleoside phosphorylase